jgi:hypothetical protein
VNVFTRTNQLRPLPKILFLLVMSNQIIKTEGRPTVYDPHIGKILRYGSTCVIRRLREGVILKSPRWRWWEPSDTIASASIKIVKRSFSVEQQILEILGEHPRIIRYSIS